MKADDISYYGAKIAALRKGVGSDFRLIVRMENHLAVLKEGEDLARLKTTSWESLSPDAPEAAVFRRIRGIAALWEEACPWSLRCLADNRSIPAALEDMAEIVGTEAAIVPFRASAMVQAFRRSSGLLVRPGRTYPQGIAMTAGRNPYEAYIAMTVLEKNAEITQKGDVLGGVRPLPLLRAVQLRRTYLYKYSRAERKSHESDR